MTCDLTAINIVRMCLERRLNFNGKFQTLDCHWLHVRSRWGNVSASGWVSQC